MIAIVAQTAVTVLCIVIVVSACHKFGDDPAEICALFTGCVAAHFIFSQAPLHAAQALAIFAGCVVGHFVYKKIFRN